MVEKETSKKGRKKWFNIYAPQEFREQIVGETPAFDISELKGRNIVVDASSIAETRRPGVKLIFKVTEIKDKGGFSVLDGYEIPQSNIRRAIRVGSSKISDSWKFKTNDNVEIIIKPVIVTRGKAVHSVLSNIRKQMKSDLKEMVASRKYTEFMMDIIRNKIQLALKDNLKKIHPVALCDFSKIERR
ncbi:MAG: hypothetical protein PHE43_00650 [Candidatus Nanoarchaeia archaeon]|nr:hypothetical protein [Candidatus Nanoarchaeia archaeon]